MYMVGSTRVISGQPVLRLGLLHAATVCTTAAATAVYNRCHGMTGMTEPLQHSLCCLPLLLLCNTAWHR
jgi:hypothetical protein